MTTLSITNSDDDSTHARLHKLISFVFEPSLVATPFIFLFVYVRRHLFTLDLQTIYLVLSLFGAIIPATYTITLYRLGIISSVFYSRRRDRLWFYPLLIFCELGVFVLFAYSSTSMALTGAAFAAIAVGVGLALLTFWHKISYHLAGLGGALSITVAILGTWGFLTLPVMILVAYSRVRLREHTWLEVTVGGLFGIITAAAAFRFFMARGHLILELLPRLGS
jgi:membrane-associated phospholipid phosphatase